MKPFYVVFLIIGLFAIPAAAQDFHMPAASPHVSIDQSFSTSFIKLDYSRPAKRGRTVFGDLIPYGEVWRTGANSTTKITFGEDLRVGGEKVAAGTYAFYTVPGKESWKVILNKGVDNWGADGFDDRENVMAIEVPVKTLRVPQESFSLTLEEVSKNEAVLRLAWDKSEIDVPIKAANDERIMAHLKEQLKGENPPYLQAAGYYLETNRKLDAALEYIDAAMKSNPQYYMYWTKAQILEKLGRHEEALKAAKKGADIAKENHPAFAYEYERNYERLKAGEAK